MPILLDTHALLWYVAGPDQLSRNARRAIDATSARLVATISFWEVGMLVTMGKIELDRPVEQWTRDVLVAANVDDAPLTSEIAAAASRLPDFHGDPADRLIVATAVAHRAPLVTKDRAIRDWAERNGTLVCTW